MPYSSKKLSVAIEALAYIAATSVNNPVSSKDVCKELGLKMRYTEAMMQELVKSGILKGVRGANGGYYIAKEKSKINLAEVYFVIKKLNKASEIDTNGSYKKISAEITKKIDTNLKELLGKITLEDVYNEVKKQI